MDLTELGDLGSGCEDENCGIASGYLEDCLNNECHWEEPVFGFIELVCVTIIYIPLMLLGLLGNILTILVVWLRPHMRSSTYLYLSSMAVSDLLILLLLPLDLYKLWRPTPWPLGDLACKLTMFLSECCTFCTILHITFLSLERYLAVCWPITAKTLVTRRRTRTLIGCLWLGAAVSAAPVLIMVGVEEVGGEERALSKWREDGRWTGREGEQGGFITGGGKGGSGHVMDGGMKLDEYDTKGWGERVEELKWVGEREERKVEIGEIDERKQRDEEMKEEKQEEREEKMEVDGNPLKEDEGGGREVPDKRECRCTHYAVSSGLLSAMMIVSNLYFLIPLCILGLVYSLIGRTLWLRPQSSRRDQSHRHTVKMLGVIVLAFVLCWLPFHVGRTIFSLSLGSGTERQETYTDTNSHEDINTLSDVSMEMSERNINIHNVTKAISHSDDQLKTLSTTGQMTADAHTEGDDTLCDICVKTQLKLSTHTDVDTQLADTEAETHTDVGADKHFYSHVISHTRGQHIDTNTTTHMETHNDLTRVNTQLSKNRNTKTSTHKHTPTTADTSTYDVTPTELYNDTHFNDTYTDADAHLFLYYLSQYFNLVSSVLFCLSAAVNPLLYNLMSARYRHAVHSLIHTHPHTPSHRLRTLTTQHSTTTL